MNRNKNAAEMPRLSNRHEFSRVFKIGLLENIMK